MAIQSSEMTHDELMRMIDNDLKNPPTAVSPEQGKIVRPGNRTAEENKADFQSGLAEKGISVEKAKGKLWVAEYIRNLPNPFKRGE